MPVILYSTDKPMVTMKDNDVLQQFTKRISLNAYTCFSDYLDPCSTDKNIEK